MVDQLVIGTLNRSLTINMKFCVLASGSKGNCTYIEMGSHKYLIDVGVNFLSISKKLEEIGVVPDEIEGIFITHIHEDHVQGLKRFLKVVNPKIYLSQKIYDGLELDIDNYELLEEDLVINDFLVESIRLSHDTDECKGYIFNRNGKSLVYITDTGYINRKYFKKLTGKTAYIIESNHDVDMLLHGKLINDGGHNLFQRDPPPSFRKKRRRKYVDKEVEVDDSVFENAKQVVAPKEVKKDESQGML